MMASKIAGEPTLYYCPSVFEPVDGGSHGNTAVTAVVMGWSDL